MAKRSKLFKILKLVSDTSKIVVQEGKKKVVKSLSDGVKGVVEPIAESLAESFSNFTGLDSHTEKSRIEKQFKSGGIRSSFGGSDFKESQNKPNSLTGKQAVAELKKMYAEAWKKKYSVIRSRYKSSDQGYKKRSWYEKKKRAKALGQTLTLSNERVRFSTWALETGVFRESIFQAFNRGSRSKYNASLEKANLLVQGGYKVDWDFFKQKYPKKNRTDESHAEQFAEFLVRKQGFYSDKEDVVNLLSQDWKKIVAVLAKYYELGLQDEMQDILSQIYKGRV